MELVEIINNEPVTNSLVVAQRTRVSHEAVIKLVRRHRPDFEELGLVRFEIRNQAPVNSGFEIRNPKGAGRPTEYAILNERQATLLITYMRNTKKVRRFKLTLVKAFFLAAQELRKQREPDVLEKAEGNRRAAGADAMLALSATAARAGHGAAFLPRLVHLTRAGLSRHEIGLVLGISGSTVLDWQRRLRHAGVDLPRLVPLPSWMQPPRPAIGPGQGATR